MRDTTLRDSHEIITLFDKDENRLKEVVKDCPSSSLVRFLLLKKMQENGDSEFGGMAQLTALYFNNPLWLNYLLADAGATGSEKAEEIEPFSEPVSEPPQEQKASLGDRQNEETEFTAGQNLEKETSEEDTEILPEQSGSGDVVGLKMEPEDLKSPDISGQEGLLSEIQEKEMDELALQQEWDDERVPEESKEVSGEDEASVGKQEELVSEQQEEEIVEEEIAGSVEDGKAASKEPEHSEEQPQEEEEALPSAQEYEQHDPAQQEERNSEVEQTQREAEVETVREAVAEQENTEDHTEMVPIEPMHTIDYFAALGIHLTAEDLEKDKLGRQLKSFTGWLKSMKKLHGSFIPEGEIEVERIIQRAAEISNKDVEVLTEAMAEVLAKQGKSGKAIEMFEKLSLSNPSKSAYFAAKIEKLKHP